MQFVMYVSWIIGCGVVWIRLSGCSRGESLTFTMILVCRLSGAVMFMGFCSAFSCLLLFSLTCILLWCRSSTLSAAVHLPTCKSHFPARCYQWAPSYQWSEFLTFSHPSVIDSCSSPSLKNCLSLQLCYPPAFLLHQSSSLHDLLNISANSLHFFQSFPMYLTTPVPPTAFCYLMF